MTFGFRRSLARHGGRTVAALAAITIVAQGGLVTTFSPPAAQRPIVVEHRVPAPHVAVAPAAATLVSHTESDVAADPPAVDPVDAAPPAAADRAAGLQPSIQYEEATRHAKDRIAFTPGNRVTVGFEPRPGDTFRVGDAAPTALPAGRLDGIAIRRQGILAIRNAARPERPGGRPAGVAPDPTVDRPGNPAPAISATSASFVIPGVEPTSAPDARVSLNGLRKEIFGFLPYWEVSSSSLRLDYRKISTIAYFGVGANADGTLQKRNPDGTISVGWSGWTSSRMSSIISSAHASHTRVVLTVQSFGWSTAGLNRQKQLLGAASRRSTLARQIAAAVRDRGADGVNLDFEPLATGYDAEFTALVRSIRYELNKIHRGYQITFDTTGSIGNYPVAAATAPGGADAIFIMGYDYRSSGSNPVGSIAPLSRTGYDIRDTIAAYTERVPASKLILGVPYYGRAWSTSSSVLHATNTSSAKTGASTTVVYDTAADYLADNGRRYDATEAVAWTAYHRQNCTATYGCVSTWRQLYVDDAAAIGAKYDLVNRYGLRGAGIWALGYDGARPELWAVIQRKFVTDTTPPKAGVRTMASRQVNPGFTVSWSGVDDVAVASFDVQSAVDGGPWHGWLSATKATSATWSGADNHSYAFRVRARDLKGNTSAWNVTSTAATAASRLAVGGFAAVQVGALSIRSGAGTGATKLGEYADGDLLAIVAGPVSADGYAWYKVVGPLTEWSAVAAATGSGWVAGSGGRLAPAKAPNATRVGAAIGDLGFNNVGAASIGAGPTPTGHRAFSPNGDGSRDALALDWMNDRPFDHLALRVFSAGGSLLGTLAVPAIDAGAAAFNWNGRIGGRRLPNGRYYLTLVGTAGGGTFYNPSTGFSSAAMASTGVRIDTVAPVVTGGSASGSLISPNGDGVLESVRVVLHASGAGRWSFSAAPIRGSAVGAAVTTKSGAGGSASVTWTGRSNGGAIVADGRYRLTLSATDNAGNHASRSWTVRVDRTPPALAPRASVASISPNGDGAADATRLAWTSSERLNGVARIEHGSTVVKSWSISGATAGAMTWTGKDSAGRTVPDGRYTFRVVGRDAAGNRASRGVSLVVDRTLGGVRWSGAAFYPQDGDALAKSAALTFSLKRTAAVTVGIYRGSTLVRTIWSSRSFAAGRHTWTWDGRDAGGAFVPGGAYTARISARSWVGTSVQTRTIQVDAFTTSLSATSLSAGQTLIVTVATTEPLGSSPRITFAQHGRAAVTRTATALGGGRYRASFRVASGASGSAVVAVVARDVAGGLNTSRRSVMVR